MSNHEIPNDHEGQAAMPGKKIERHDSKPAKEPVEENKTVSFMEMINDIDRIATELDQLRKSQQDSSMAGVESPDLNKKIETDKNKLADLEKAKQKWVAENGLKELPESVVIETDNGQALKINLEPETAEKLGKEERKRIIDDWKEKATKKFAAALEDNWRTKDAINLSLTVDIIKTNLPALMEKRMQSFVNGETDLLPDHVLMQWKHNSLLDTLMGKPNQIRELSFQFGEETVILAGPEQLIKEGSEKKDQRQENNNPEKPEPAVKQAA